jgi:hypothetical protein
MHMLVLMMTSMVHVKLPKPYGTSTDDMINCGMSSSLAHWRLDAECTVHLVNSNAHMGALVRYHIMPSLACKFLSAAQERQARKVLSDQQVLLLENVV